MTRMQPAPDWDHESARAAAKAVSHAAATANQQHYTQEQSDEESQRRKYDQRQREEVVLFLKTKFIEYCRSLGISDVRNMTTAEQLLLYAQFCETEISPAKTDTDALQTIEKGLAASPRQTSRERDLQSQFRLSLPVMLKALVKNPAAITWKSELDLLKRTIVHATPPAMPQDVRRKCIELHRMLRESKDTVPPHRAAMSIHAVAGRAIVHVADTAGNAAFVEVPGALDPTDVARRILLLMQQGLETAVGTCDPLAVCDGECRSINFKALFPSRVVVRTMSSQADGVADRISRLRNMSAPRPEDTAIVNGIPADEAQTNRVFQNAQYSSEWSHIAREWATVTVDAGYQASPGSKATVLSSLASKKNVIILVAHANRVELRLPAAPPEDRVRIEDLKEISAAIRENNPVVYLYCCETARFDGLTNWAAELLQHGATAVYAPQVIIETEKTRKLYAQFLRSTSSSSSLLAAIADSEQKSGCRELETWIG